jgi:hypothetical protein
LEVVTEFNDTADFASVVSVPAVISDPDPDDSLKTLTFTDHTAGAAKRFARLKLTYEP